MRVNISKDDLVSRRMTAQLLVRPAGSTSGARLGSDGARQEIAEAPEEVVAWIGGIQAQDYSGGKWSIGCRLPVNPGQAGVESEGASTAPAAPGGGDPADAAPVGSELQVERAIVAGRIIRTRAYRGTLHLLAAADVPWVLPLLAPVVIAGNQRRYRQLEPDEPTLTRSTDLIRSGVQEGPPVARSEICTLLEREGVSAGGQRAAYLLPPFDDYLLGYRRRGFALDPAFRKRVNAGGGMLKPLLVLGGGVAGVWKQTRRHESTRISVELFRDLARSERRAVEDSVQRYALYLGRPVELD